MNLKSRLQHIAFKSMKDRMMGRTTLIARAAKELGGIVLAHNFSGAKQIEHAHAVTARSMEINLDGFSGPFFLDHHATDIMLLRAADKIEELEKQQKSLIEVLDKHLGQKSTDEVLREIGISELRAYK